MRTIVHLSDLHFNRIDPRLLEPLAAAIAEVNPDILAVSGDLTQNAEKDEFIAAMDFIRALPGRLIVVPGNHDMAFYNVWRRLTTRLSLFRRYVTKDAEPFYEDDEIAILGLNTARVSHLRDGHIREWQIRRLEERMGAVRRGVIRVLVTHHPFDLPEIFPDNELIGRGRNYIARVLKTVDVLLAGHMHVSHAGPTAIRFRAAGCSAVFVQAGTALSTRTRSECNSFQVIHASEGTVETRQFVARSLVFIPESRQVFTADSGGWQLRLREQLAAGS